MPCIGSVERQAICLNSYWRTPWVGRWQVQNGQKMQQVAEFYDRFESPRDALKYKHAQAYPVLVQLRDSNLLKFLSNDTMLGHTSVMQYVGQISQDICHMWINKNHHNGRPYKSILNLTILTTSGHPFWSVPRGGAARTRLWQTARGDHWDNQREGTAARGLLHQESYSTVRDHDRQTRRHVGWTYGWRKDFLLWGRFGDRALAWRVKRVLVFPGMFLRLVGPGWGKHLLLWVRWQECLPCHVFLSWQFWDYWWMMHIFLPHVLFCKL